jgi:hypothetical protein
MQRIKKKIPHFLTGALTENSYKLNQQALGMVIQSDHH